MNASKENVRKALVHLQEAALLLDNYLPKEKRDEVKWYLLMVQEVLEASERKLPTEAAFERETQRRKAKANLGKKGECEDSSWFKRYLKPR